jgi:hypothetical protein
MRAKIEEFKSCKIVKIELIKIEIRAKSELYHGKKKAIKTAKTKINTHKISLKLITFQTINADFSLLFVISLIVIA